MEDPLTEVGFQPQIFQSIFPKQQEQPQMHSSRPYRLGLPRSGPIKEDRGMKPGKRRPRGETCSGMIDEAMIEDVCSGRLWKCTVIQRLMTW